MNLGYSHPVEIEPAEGITFETPAATKVVVSGIDKQLVGAAAADIRKWRKPEPYKGKGIKFEGEVIRLSLIHISITIRHSCNPRSNFRR